MRGIFILFIFCFDLGYAYQEIANHPEKETASGASVFGQTYRSLADMIILPVRQSLIFEGKQLEDDRTLSEYDIQEKSICIQTFVKTLADEAITLAVEAVDLIDKGKASVPEKEGIPPVYQCLIYGNKQLEDDRTLLEYDVQKETSIHLRLCLRTGMQIYAKTLACKTITFEAEASDTFDSVRDEYALHLLPDLRVGMQLLVQILICKTITSDVMAADMIDKGTRVQDKEGNPPAHQCLRMVGKQSEDGRALSEYSIQREAALPLVLRLREYRLIFGKNLAGKISPQLLRTQIRLTTPGP